MNPEAPLLSLSGVTKHYDDFQLGPLDLVLEPGQVLAFVGPNGAGKSTTLHAVMRLLRPDGGEIRIGGIDNDPANPAWKQHIGFVGEAQGFFRGWSVRRNLDFIGRFYERWDSDRAESLARRFDLALDKPFAALSRGNRAKLSLVAALAHDPLLLLLDEPTQGLDPVVRTEVLDALWETMEDGRHAILYSTHVLSDIARLADELAFLRHGRLVARCAKDDLTEAWRRISFRLDRPDTHLDGLDGARGLRRQGVEHQVVSSDHEATQRHLRELGASAIQLSRMTIDEITIEILKEDHHAVLA